MLALRELQTAFRRALLEDAGAFDALGALIVEDGMEAAERLAVYRNNVFASLTEALRESFPATRRVVGERFFDYAAHEFIASHPPNRPALSEYGGAFSGFLASFPPSRELVYLEDLAGFEWLLNEAASAPDEAPASPEILAEIPAEDAARLTFRLHPSYRYLDSRWPIERIWRANQSDAESDVIDLGAGGVRLEICRQNGDVGFRALDAAPFAFRRALAGGACLGDALEAGLTAGPDFSPTEALTTLFRERAVASIAQESSDKEHRSR